MIGNAIANMLNGGGGNDTMTGGGGNDTIIGGAGTDTAVYSGNRANYAITYDATHSDLTVVDQRSGSPDGTDTVTGVENFQFADSAVAAASLGAQPRTRPHSSIVQRGGNRRADHCRLQPVRRHRRRRRCA